MRAINHSLTGALIGLTVSEPLIAAPLALASHYVMDAIPHHGGKPSKTRLSNKPFIISLFLDAILCGALVLLLVAARPVNWILAIVCAFLAAAPDFLSINRFYKGLKGRPWKANLYTRFAGGIQWFERPIGAVTEAAWFVAMVIGISIFIVR